MALAYAAMRFLSRISGAGHSLAWGSAVFARKRRPRRAGHVGASYALASRYVTFSVYPIVASPCSRRLLPPHLKIIPLTADAPARPRRVFDPLSRLYLFLTSLRRQLALFSAPFPSERLTGTRSDIFSAVFDTPMIKKTVHPPGAERACSIRGCADQLKLLRPRLVRTKM